MSKLVLFFDLLFNKIYKIDVNNIARSAEAIEYTDHFFAEG